MKVRILGCGGSSGVPAVGGTDGGGLWGRCDPNEPRNRRMRSSIVIDGGGGQLLVDSGPDLRAQLLGSRITRCDAVIYTHQHADHIAGLDELRSINRIIGKPLPLFATSVVLAELKARFSYAFEPWTPPEFFRPVFDVHEIRAGEQIRAAAMDVTLIPQQHGRIESLGIRCGHFAYCTDVHYLTSAALEALAGVDTWMVDCFQYAPHNAHAWLDQVMEWRAVFRPRRTILTHMGAEMDYGQLCSTLPEGVEAAYDGMVLEIP